MRSNINLNPSRISRVGIIGVLSILLGTIVLVVVSATSVATNPHDLIMPLPDSCSSCHRAHSALGDSIIRESSHNDLCLSCHDGTGATTIISTHSNALEESPPTHFSRQEEIFILNCTGCHSPHGPQTNNCLILGSINDYDVVFTATSGNYSYDENSDDADDTDDICVTCHINSTNNPGYPVLSHEGGNHIGTNGYSGDLRSTDCTYCHPHNPDSISGSNDGFMTCSTGGSGCHGLPPNGGSAPNRNGAHVMHYSAAYGPLVKSCEDCHSPVAVGDGHDDGNITFTDGQQLATTDACSGCHSQSGFYDGVAEAKANWLSGTRVTCKGCHDAGTSVINGVAAPNTIGDGSTYGYYVTGHGMNDLVECSDCHDPDTTHFDGESRTYNAGSSDYQTSYRLAYTMTIPLQSGDGQDEADFALCFECHQYDGIFDSSDPFMTNFRKDGGMGKNLHSAIKHLGNSADQWDSDWDTAGWQTGLDSRASCPTCHNVHGSASERMTRYGELTGFSLDFSSSGTGGSCSDMACHTMAKNYMRSPIIDGLTDLAEPLVLIASPQNEATEVAVNGDLVFTLSDNATVVDMGVDWTTFQIQLSGDLTYDQTYTDVSSEVSETGSSASYNVTVNPSVDFPYGENITAALSVNDLSPWANALTAPTWWFVTEQDTITPAISNQNPSPGATDIALDSDLAFTLSDSQAGVDWTTFSINITGNGYSQNYTGASPEVSQAGGPASYNITVNPGVDFPNGVMMTVAITVADDQHESRRNTLISNSWTFTTINQPPQISSINASQSTDGTQIVTIGYTGTDAENDLCTYVAQDCEYSLNSTDGSDGNWFDMTRQDTGDEGFTSGGAGLSYEWNVGTDAFGIEDSNVWTRLKVNDGIDDSALATIAAAFAIDTAVPAGPADFQAASSDNISVSLTWTSAADGNFNHYEIWYDDAAIIDRSVSDTEWDNNDDANLAMAGTASTTITGLDAGTTYYFKIWAVDDFGNESTVAEINYSTEP